MLLGTSILGNSPLGSVSNDTYTPPIIFPPITVVGYSSLPLNVAPLNSLRAFVQAPHLSVHDFESTIHYSLVIDTPTTSVDRVEVSPYDILINIGVDNEFTSLYSDYSVVDFVITSSYSDTVQCELVFTSLYGNVAAIDNVLVSPYSNTAILDTTTVSLYSSTEILDTTTVSFYSSTVIHDVEFTSKYSVTSVVDSELISLYSNTVLVDNTTTSLYSSSTTVNNEQMFFWGIRKFIENETSSHYSIDSINKLSSVLHSKYAIEDGSVISIESAPKLYDKNDNEIEFIRINMSCDEKSPYIIADVVLSNQSDFIYLNVKDTLKIVFNSSTYNFIIDSRNQTREEGFNEYLISLISPTALLDNPFANTTSVTYPTATLASVVVSDVVGYIEWNLPDWLIPVEQLQFVDTTPMQIARKIVSAIGGVVETSPEGVLICRKTYPVNTNKYMTTDLDAEFLDSDILNSTESIAPKALFNKVDVYNTSLINFGVSDSTEYVKNEGTYNSGVIYGYPKPFRPVDLVHTGDPSTQINAVGDFERIETEQVEFIGGKATSRYPITSITSLVWNAVNLGTVSYSGKDIKSAVAGESLLKITYVVKSKKWEVSSDVNDDVQFLLLDSVI